MDRRAFLSASLCLVCGTFLLKGRPSLPKATHVSVLFDNLERIRAVGSAFRASHPQVPITRASAAQLQDLLHLHSASIERDFERGHLLAINGWLVSYTEATICAAV